MDIVECGLYILKDCYFDRFNSSGFMMDNKYQSRPYYCGMKLSSGIIWMIPLSSQVEKYRQKISDVESSGKDCISYYISNLKGKKSVFLIGDCIPCTEKYILRAFTLGGVPFVIQDKTDIKCIRSKLSRYLSLVRSGRLSPFVDILNIESILKKEPGV